MRLLIVDDEPVNVALLKSLLADEGFTAVAGLTDSRDVIDKCREWHPDVVLLDLMMPWIDGYGVLAQLRSETTNVYLPVMVLTADITESSRKRALAAGATDFLTKPFDRTECLLRIRNLLTTRKLHAELAAQNTILEQKVQERTAALEATLVELRAAQHQIVQRERLSALGAMVTGIAHDFNNSLALILGYGERLQRECRTRGINGAVPDCAQTIVTAAIDAAETVARLRNFHRPADPGEARIPLQLGDIVQQAIAFTRPRWQAESLGLGAPIECVSDLSDHPPIAGHAAELREMLTNLVFNAVDAMPQGGQICLRTFTRGERVVLEVADAGTGMTEEVRRRCLEPFFTTKGDRGSGLGLAMVYGIVQRHEGTMEIESVLGQGTTFIFSFPVDHSGIVPEPTAPAQITQPLRILVVDDQPVLTEILAEMLARDWHTVTTAPDGRTALEKFQATEFDLVITDKAMPEMNGDQLAAAIKARAPEVPVLMLTGFGDLGESGEGLSEFIDDILTKPATGAELRAAIARVTAPLARR